MKMIAGMDLASESVYVSVMSEASKQVLQRQTMSWEPARWKRWVEEYGAENLIVAFETGPEAYRAKALLDRLGVESYPFHAKSFGAIGRAKKKTDKIDSRKIARALRGGSLPRRVILPEPPMAKLRNLVTERVLLQKIQSQLRGRVRGMNRQWGAEAPPYDSEHPQQWWLQAAAGFAPEQRCQIERLQLVALAGLQAAEKLDEEIEAQVEVVGLAEQAARLRSLPGVGPVVSNALTAYLGDGMRFSTGRQFASYLGLVPSVDQTGKRAARLGHITKEGPPVLRWLFVLAANAAVGGYQLDRTRWSKWFERLARRRGRKIAIVALARKLAILSYAIVRDGTEWNPDRLRPTVRPRL